MCIIRVTGQSAQSAVEASIVMMYERVGGDGGSIAIDRASNIGIYFNVQGMAWASCQSGVLRRGIYRSELFTEAV